MLSMRDLEQEQDFCVDACTHERNLIAQCVQEMNGTVNVKQPVSAWPLEMLLTVTVLFHLICSLGSPFNIFSLRFA
jgi:hypothetical protein